MNPQEKFDRFVERYPHPHKFCFARPHLSRRDFFSVAGAGITASVLAGPLRAATKITSNPVSMQNKAKNVIFVLMAGAPSHTDTFDLKMVNGVTPAGFSPATIGNGLLWPTGLLPKLAGRINDIAVVRSVRSWALVHTLAQTWTQIGRNPAAALGNIAPNIGSIVSVEKNAERIAGQVFPTFLALNSGGAMGNGYLPASYAPFKVNEPGGSAANTQGIANTTNADGQARLDERYSLLQLMDGGNRVNSPYGTPMEDMASFYEQARGMEYSNVVNTAFRYSAADSVRYGGTNFGNACLVAKQVLEAKQGTRFIQITLGGWDMHQNIYQGNNLVPGSATALSTTFDNGLGTLLADLSSAGLLDQTLVVAVGEFGRTVGNITGAAGRDHFAQQSAFFAGAGIRGGRAIGSTNATGSATLDTGWSGQRDVKPEDIEATIYSAMGINWTSVRYDDPFGRGFEYVPFGNQGLYKPVDELWA